LVSFIIEGNHISTSTGKARSRCVVFFKKKLSPDEKTMLLIFTTYVRPLLESSCLVSSPVSSADNYKPENVQRVFNNRIRGCTFLPSHQRLSIYYCHSTASSIDALFPISLHFIPISLVVLTHSSHHIFNLQFLP